MWGGLGGVLPLWPQAAEYNWWRRRVSLAKTVIRHHYMTVQQHNDCFLNAASATIFSPRRHFALWKGFYFLSCKFRPVVDGNITA